MFYVESMYDIIMRFPFKVILFNLMSFFWMFSGGTMFIIFKVCSPPKTLMLKQFALRTCLQSKISLNTTSSACRWLGLVT